MNPVATPIFDEVVAEAGLQWPGPDDHEPDPSEPPVTTVDP
ncbi:hypothetical protein AB0J40_22895 [Amycolatopsis sp. NPDC049691]